MKNNTHEIVARVYRGESVEAIHCGSIAVVNADGELTHYVGDPELLVATRSSIKPFQVLPLLTTGAADRFGFTTRELAIMCGSHNGTDEHRDVVLSNLAKAGCKPDHLQCGTHWPLQMQEECEYPTAGEDSDPVRHNCSGKHSGFLALAQHLDVDIIDYLNPESSSQKLVRQAVAEICDFPEDKMPPSIDGCSAPNYPLPLRNLALGFARLANRSDKGDATSLALARVSEAMRAYPEMVSGRHRLDFDIMRSFSGNVLCKVGAEAIEGVGFSDPPIGIAIKIHDGNFRALGVTCIEVFGQLDLIDKISDFPLMETRARQEVRNNRNLLTGYVVPEFKLRAV